MFRHLNRVANRILRPLGVRLAEIAPPTPFESIGYADPFTAKSRLLGNQADLVIFDVGGYHGVMASYYRDRFPHSKVYCFEPFPKSFEELIANVGHDPSIIAFNQGFADKSGDREFFSNAFAPTNSLLRASSAGNAIWGDGVFDEQSRIIAKFGTIDEFVSTHGIDRIDIMKLDVQGAEHLVLEGARDMLCSKRVALIYGEITVMPTYEGQQELHQELAVYRQFGFRLHSIYNPSFAPNGAIRQFDGLFHLA